MEESKFRVWTKAVAIVELVLDSLALGALILLGIALAFVGVDGVVGNDDGTSSSHQDYSVDGFGVFVLVTVLAIVIGTLALSMWFSYNLLQATTLGTDTTMAIRRAKRWRIFTIVLFVLSLFSLGKMECLASKIIGMIFRILCIWIVHMFIKDLEMDNWRHSSPPLNSKSINA